MQTQRRDCLIQGKIIVQEIKLTSEQTEPNTDIEINIDSNDRIDSTISKEMKIEVRRQIYREIETQSVER